MESRSSLLRVASSVYWNAVVQGLYIQDVWMGLIKPFFLGFTIASIGCHVGLRTSGGTQVVGRWPGDPAYDVVRDVKRHEQDREQ